ncbi:MDR family MFS transporter [Allokutzneria albata]|uniref:Drug resistance transporter, EmrB/QacA subfamily n=1 Tax=Allokutzneria albata TaxID=211114 RepID=A0A1G9ZHU7_ALLAB|nr:MDR family MFS transporter [Allokutzneria albata]SDN21032.1 drug resistance transporter, EmrB/QacA subfamily [Allokutzneria albata]
MTETAPMSHREILRAMTGLLLALLVAILSSTIVANALPTILADLKGTQSQYTWVVTATLLASTATTPIWGKLADLFSKKLLYQVAIGLFTLGSVLCGLARSMPELIAYRAVQGLGLGGVQALAQVVIAAMVSPRERGRYSGYTGSVLAVATVAGPLAGGFIVDTDWLGWRWCFFVVVPLALLAMYVIGRTLHLPVLRREVSIDWAGATLVTGGVSLLLIWISLVGKNFPWLSWQTAAFVAGSLVTLAAALVVEGRVREPVIPLRLFRNRTLVLGVLASIAVGTGMFGASVFLGQYFQLARGFSPTVSGLLTLPLIFGLLTSSTLSGQLITRTGRWKGFLVSGAVLMVLGLALMAGVDHSTSLWLLGCYQLLLGLGLGLSTQNLVLAVQNATDIRDLGSASSTVTFFRSLGGTAGVSVLGAVLAAQVSELVTEKLHGATGGGSLDLAHLPEPARTVVRDAYGDATGLLFLIAAVISLVTLVSVLLIKEVPLRGSSTATEDKPVDNELGIGDNSGRPVGTGVKHVSEVALLGGRNRQRVEQRRRSVDSAVDEHEPSTGRR